MTDMTGWILRDRAWRDHKAIVSSEIYLVLGPVPSRPPYERWTLLNIRTNERFTLKDEAVRNAFRYKRVA